MSDKITRQWDIGHTAFTSATGLRNLIQAVSVEDVQPQAVLAAEALGFSIGLRVSPELIDKAIIALRGSESVRWDNFKLLIGVSSSALINTVRTSTSLIAFFLFACAWKPCFTDSEVGDLAFQMIAESGILRKLPVASSQLCSFIKSFSGHSEALIPADLMHDLAVEINDHSPNAFELFRRATTKSLGEVLVRIFDLLMDESVDNITVSGSTGGIWLATSLFWLMPEMTCLSIDGKTFKGCNKLSKLTLELITKSYPEIQRDSWTFREWRAALA